MLRSTRISTPAVAFTRRLSRVAPPPVTFAEPVIRVCNNLARLGPPKEGPKPRQLLSLPPFPHTGVDPLPGRKCSPPNPLDGSLFPRWITAITWVKHYFHEVAPDVIQSHFRDGMKVQPSRYHVETFQNDQVTYFIHWEVEMRRNE
ncbi:hypothetical protein KSP40_PGU010293 [Platanthera guangdongensis]|uniref:Uncharacterized protein n=1 Tax=Platanthera guangdongensis TaxID=2320717 RepID=A0ABR2LSX3_9ASPA